MTKEQDFKNRLFAVLKDLQESGLRDNETMWLLGSLASDLVDDLGASDWTSAKRDMDYATYNELLRTFETEGNAHHQAGRPKQAYAIQAMVLSLIARTQRADAEVATGELLLDELIAASTIAYRRNKTSRGN